jgi:Putative prokaryotic signal transducing protein
MPPEGPLVVATFPLPTEAEMARELLERNGIEAILRDAGFLGVHPWLSNAVGGVKVVVPAEDARRAREILVFAGLAARVVRIVADG